MDRKVNTLEAKWLYNKGTLHPSSHLADPFGPFTFIYDVLHIRLRALSLSTSVFVDFFDIHAFTLMVMLGAIPETTWPWATDELHLRTLHGSRGVGDDKSMGLGCTDTSQNTAREKAPGDTTVRGACELPTD